MAKYDIIGELVEPVIYKAGLHNMESWTGAPATRRELLGYCSAVGDLMWLSSIRPAIAWRVADLAKFM
jgi:hypothetical protein